MQSDMWQDYGTPGTQALGREDIEQAITRLAQLWDDARTQDENVTPAQECCDCCYPQAS